MKYKNRFQVLECTYKNCSINGNPKKHLILLDNAGNVLHADTATDAMCGYLHYAPGKQYTLTYHYTRKSGNMIIDYSEEV